MWPEAISRRGHDDRRSAGSAPAHRDRPELGPIERPGLGIEIDEAKLARYREAFRRDGQFLPYAA
jgi:hypothetical protein